MRSDTLFDPNIYATTRPLAERIRASETSVCRNCETAIGPTRGLRRLLGRWEHHTPTTCRRPKPIEDQEWCEADGDDQQDPDSRSDRDALRRATDRVRRAAPMGATAKAIGGGHDAD